MIMKKNQKYQECTNSRDKLRHEIVQIEFIFPSERRRYDSFPVFTFHLHQIPTGV